MSRQACENAESYDLHTFKIHYLFNKVPFCKVRRSKSKIGRKVGELRIGIPEFFSLSAELGAIIVDIVTGI
jgi:hypothetical protein